LIRLDTSLKLKSIKYPQQKRISFAARIKAEPKSETEVNPKA
jgi:hypothetical protein